MKNFSLHNSFKKILHIQTKLHKNFKPIPKFPNDDPQKNRKPKKSPQQHCT